MTAPAPTFPPAARPAAVDQRLARATAGLCRDHPGAATAVRGVLAPLRDRLRRVHEQCQQAEAAAWAVYTADLDRGLDELSVEIGRAAERPGAAVDEVLSTAAVRLELRAWQLRLRTLRGEGRDVQAAEQLADRLDQRLAQVTDTDAVAPLNDDLADLRRAVTDAERG
ncbi:hypothetical protein [Modestobacter italicus]|uniref:hypothetical protein n=1 Tax=Modestobacter italicus (strain DSM 44449 / CECT 9708 / BC 501) TaxID=2732864 RepID=UPI001C974FF6|nr:hypothetical protein [Modestobacter italicus]